MSSLLNTHSVLCLNALWQAIGTTTVQKAIVAMNSNKDGETSSAKAIDIVYKKNTDGTYNFEEVDYFNSVTFEEWINLEIREGLDKFISSPNLKVRYPTVILTRYNKMPMRKFRPTIEKLYEMQDGRCGYSNERLSKNQASLEHRVPKSYGGKNTFENLLVVKKEINQKRGNKPLAEVGLTPLFHHKEPKPIPVCYTIKKIMHQDWKWFL